MSAVRLRYNTFYCSRDSIRFGDKYSISYTFTPLVYCDACAEHKSDIIYIIVNGELLLIL